ncbi:uncharacterized protein LOC124361913 [Homalodisca vitripennis]|uniref:uncharacterized protein LOC124361913 n=1 Tax=Homalodisca vitripennis TaxID=197043 RepID=UPI001EECF37F|nr:uncharacterized protein LOC124361913 [Homalodisca vitripennis]
MMMKEFKILLVFVFILLVELVSAKPRSELHNGMLKDLANIQPLTAKKVIKAIQGLETTHKQQVLEGIEFIKSKSLKVEKVLSSLPKQCSQEVSEETNGQKTTALTQLSNCNGKEIIENLIDLGLVCGKFFAEMVVDGTLIISNFIACISSSDHLSFTRVVTCIFKVAAIFPEEIKEIIEVSEEYAKAVYVLVPEIVDEIKSCYSPSSNMTVSCP